MGLKLGFIFILCFILFKLTLSVCVWRWSCNHSDVDAGEQVDT